MSEHYGRADVCRHGGLRRKCETCDYEAENADLRDRLALLRYEGPCTACKCAPRRGCDLYHCHDCHWANPHGYGGQCAAACLSVGMRALAGRRLAP